MYPDNFHHLKSLHAKVIVAGNKAIAGSANFTYSGVTSSAEMSVLFQEEPQVQELFNWFENLWCCSTSIDIAELQVYNDALPDEIQTSQPDLFPTLTCPAPPIKSRLRTISTSSKIITANEDAVDLLIERIKITPNRQWINSYFELMKTILEATGLTSDDPRLVTSIPSGRWFLPMTINNRYILAPSKKRGSFIIGVIFGPEYEMLPEVQAETISDGQFNPLRGENFLETPYFLRLADITRINQSSQLKNGWIRAALLELERAKSSPYRKHHQPVVYEAAVNLDFRNMILDRAFPNV